MPPGPQTPALRPVPAAAADIDRYVYASDLAAVGAYRCAPDHAWFTEPGPIVNHCVVFPRTRLVVEPDGHAPFVGDENTVAVYNTGQRFRRRAIGRAGDRCDYFAVPEGVLREIARAQDPAAADRERLFARSHLVGSPALYLRQRRLFHAASAARTAHLGIDEQILALVAAVLAAGRRGGAAPAAGRAAAPRHVALAEAARLAIARRIDEPLRLTTLARAVGSSPFHLCRVFRAVTGTTLHQYRERLRLAEGLTRLEGRDSLTAIALDLGYSSHSHFTAAFGRTYGLPPARARRWLARAS